MRLRDIKYMPVVKFLKRLDLEQKSHLWTNTSEYEIEKSCFLMVT